MHLIDVECCFAHQCDIDRRMVTYFMFCLYLDFAWFYTCLHESSLDATAFLPISCFVSNRTKTISYFLICFLDFSLGGSSCMIWFDETGARRPLSCNIDSRKNSHTDGFVSVACTSCCMHLKADRTRLFVRYFASVGDSCDHFGRSWNIFWAFERPLMT